MPDAVPIQRTPSHKAAIRSQADQLPTTGPGHRAMVRADIRLEPSNHD